MRHVSTLLLVLGLLAAGITASAQVIDPNIGFCAPPATAAGCSGQPETNGIGTTSFGMWSFGSNDANSPWYLLVAIPVANTNGAFTSLTPPTITSGSFTISAGVKDTNPFLSTTSGDIYNFAATSGNTPLPSSFNVGNNSMNASNLFGSLEQAAYGKTPAAFAIVVYTVTCGSNPCINGNTAYSFGVSPGLPAGTFVAAVALGGSNGNIQFSTPFTTTGLVGGPIPEPASLTLMGSGLMLLAGALRRRFLA